MRALTRSTILRALAAPATLALVALLAACGPASASGASAQATATCPPAPRFLAITGSVTAVSSASVTVQPASGASVTVALASATRYSLTTSVPATSLTGGTSVLVLTDTTATTARSVHILPATTANGNGTGGFGGGFNGGPRGTPRPGANPACARRGGAGGFDAGAGTDGTGGFQGLRGTVDSATGATLTFDDAQGQTYSVAITPTTTITKTTTVQASALTAGARVTIAAQKLNGQTIARAVTILA